ncbi:MAG: putative exported protein [Cenarchaeum symbiont of Oopsacas minuta]|nr:putative exported protein [Cenarchaeum symbiont of Oopsacas minuta]
MTKNTIYVIFLLPVVAGIALGAIVFAQAIEEGYFLVNDARVEQNSDIQIRGLEHTYHPSVPIEIYVIVSDKSYDCGDLYITVYDSASKSVSQNGYFGECFVDKGVNLPTSETYSEKIDKRGKYTIEAKMYDHIDSIRVKETFYIR